MNDSNTRQNQRKLDNQRHIEVFKEEAKERLAELEEAMLELEASPGNSELVDSAFRAMHTIKGSGSMFGFDEIASFTHDIETVYDQVREGNIEVTPHLIALTLSAHDQMQKMLEDPDNDKQEDIDKRKEITDSFKLLLPGAAESSIEEAVQAVQPEEKMFPETELASYRIRFYPAVDIFANGTNPVLLLNELRDLGECQVISKLENMPLLYDLDPEKCFTGWDIILTTHQPLNLIEDVFIFIDESSQVSIEIISIDGDLEEEPVKRIGEILVERGDIEKEALDKVLKQKEPIGKILTNAGLTKESQIQSALAEQQVIKKMKSQQKKEIGVSSIRVDSHKLDKLVDLVGELVTGQARLSQIANSSSDSSLLSIAEEIERLTTELRDSTMSVRMLNFGTTFNRFKRLVRDLSQGKGENILFKTEGAETELDKTVIEQLNDPLVHIIRNSADHGIEMSDVRVAAGKPKQGTISLSADHEGDHVVIKITDDGAGLDVDAIRDKAVSKGLIPADAKLTDREIYPLIFEPGFSTAKTITNISGRGVGMDVVKKAIEALRGTIEIESQKTIGTTIRLILPLTLAIIDGLLIRVGNEYFVIPLTSVEECIELTEDDVQKSHGRHITNVRGQIVPYIRLREQFSIEGEVPEIEQVVITKIDNNRIGFVVDHVIGQHQTVIKNLSKVYKNVDAVSGATIMADGTVALILDIKKHLLFVEKEALEQCLTN